MCNRSTLVPYALAQNREMRFWRLQQWFIGIAFTSKYFHNFLRVSSLIKLKKLKFGNISKRFWWNNDQNVIWYTHCITSLTFIELSFEGDPFSETRSVYLQWGSMWEFSLIIHFLYLSGTHCKTYFCWLAPHPYVKLN